MAFRESRMPDQVRHDTEIVNEILPKRTRTVMDCHASNIGHKLDSRGNFMVWGAVLFGVDRIGDRQFFECVH